MRGRTNILGKTLRLSVLTYSITHDKDNSKRTKEQAKLFLLGQVKTVNGGAVPNDVAEVIDSVIDTMYPTIQSSTVVPSKTVSKPTNKQE